MFVLARADAGVYPVETREFYLDEVIEESVRAARMLGQSKDVRVELDALHELTCVGDEELVRQLVLILLDNAVKYTPRGGSVRVSAEERGGQYLIDVRDTGPGIPAEAQQRIFDRFYRVDKARSRSLAQQNMTQQRTNAGSGAGLGLSIALWIAELHGGTLALMESTAQGTWFRATIQRRMPVTGPKT